MEQTFLLCFLGLLFLVLIIVFLSKQRQKKVKKVAQKLDLNFDEIREEGASLEIIFNLLKVVEKIKENPENYRLTSSQEKMYYDYSLIYAKRKIAFFKEMDISSEDELKYQSVINGEAFLEFDLFYLNVQADLFAIQIKADDYQSKVETFKAYLNKEYAVELKNIFEYKEGLNYFLDSVFEVMDDDLYALETFFALVENTQEKYLEI